LTPQRNRQSFAIAITCKRLSFSFGFDIRNISKTKNKSQDGLKNPDRFGRGFYFFLWFVKIRCALGEKILIEFLFYILFQLSKMR